MLGKVFGMIGGAVGEYFGGGIFKTIGRSAGNMLGRYLQAEIDGPIEYERVKGSIIDEVQTLKSRYGTYIPKIYGTARVAGNVIWSQVPRFEVNTATNIDRPSPFLRGRQVTESQYSNYINFAIAICEGEVDSIERVWFGEQEVNLSDFKYRLYPGNESQLPDPLILEDLGNINCPAFRGLAYIIFEDFPLNDYSGNVPNINFEVRMKSKYSNLEGLNNNLKAINIIPGSGEYVIDTDIVTKKHGFSNKPINFHKPDSGKSDAAYSLDHLLSRAPNLEWVSVVVGWFGNSLNAGSCQVYPGIEFKEAEFSKNWSVCGIPREQAKVLHRDKYGNPAYGGTYNDQSLENFIKYAKSKGLKVMLYPMLFMDIAGKPWRGHITGDQDSINKFFEKNGYNKFILHYANMAKNCKVDAYIIGSEFKKLTEVMPKSGHFPAVDKLVELTSKAKSIVGSSTIVTYAADWSEYHHTNGGWHHLDKLWASPDIDVIGIDAYFPLTRSTSINISREDIKEGWFSGEGYNYYYDGEEQKPLSPDYAWKNIKHWWGTSHRQPDGTLSPWVPKSKKIWFTEFGFASVDKSSNQPNIFPGTDSIDAGLPLYSDGQVSFESQQKAIEASLAAFKDARLSECLANSFLYCWDARCPIFPNFGLWDDSGIWEKGHWVKFPADGGMLGQLYDDIIKTAGASSLLEDAGDTSFKPNISGMVVNYGASYLQILNNLRFCKLHDLKLSNNNIISKYRTKNIKSVIDCNNMALDDKGDHLTITQISPVNMLKGISASFYDIANSSKPSFSNKSFDDSNSFKQKHINMPFVASHDEMERIMSQILENIHAETMEISFSLPYEYLYLEPADVIKITDNNEEIIARITEITHIDYAIYIKAIVDNVDNYRYLSLSHQDFENNLTQTRNSNFVTILTKKSTDNAYNIYVASLNKERISISHDNNIYGEFCSNLGQNIFKLVSFEDKCQTSYLKDYASRIILKSDSLPEKGIIILNGEAIYYEQADFKDGNMHLSCLTRNLWPIVKVFSNMPGDVYLLDENSTTTLNENLVKSGVYLRSEDSNIVEKIIV